MKLIVGLGNPGKEYAKTRHNIGFRVLDVLAEKLNSSFDRSKFKGDYADGTLAQPGQDEDLKLLLVKPQTFMNLSGETVLGFSGFYKIPVADLLVVSDDVTMPVGTIRMRRGGSDGGHNGLKDITRRLGTQQFSRLRFGVGGREPNAGMYPADLAGHVLSRFSSEEEALLAKQFAQAAEACLFWARRGIEAAMNQYNAAEKPEKKKQAETKDQTNSGTGGPALKAPERSPKS